MIRIRFVAHNLDDTDRLGAALAESLSDGTTIALCGTLGAGKTRLVQAVAAHVGVPRQNVVSPTFVLCQEYQGARTIVHYDAFRIRDDDEFRQLGPDEYFRSPALIFVEWAERVSDSLPAQRIEIHIEVLDNDQRVFEIQAHGERYAQFLKTLARQLEPSIRRQDQGDSGGDSG